MKKEQAVKAAEVEINDETVVEVEETGLVIGGEPVAVGLSPSMFENTSQAIFTSIKGSDRVTSIKIYNAINNAENALGDFKGEVLEITDMVAHPITLQDENTGEEIQAMRVVLLTADGVGYHSVATGIVSSLQKVIGTVGPAPWTPALQLTPIEVKTRKGFKTLTLKLIG